MGGRRESAAGKLSLSPSGTKITSFAQSVLALHKLQDGAGANFEKPVSKRKISYLESGIGLPGVYGYKVSVANHEHYFNNTKSYYI